MAAADQFPWLEGFSDEQVACAIHDHKHALVSAAPGSGKTKMVIGRVGVLLARGVPAERLLGLAFNVDAAREVNKRLAALPLRNAKGVKFRTIHSFCKEVVEVCEEEGFLPKRSLVTSEFDMAAMARDALSSVLREVGDVDELRVAAVRQGLTLAKANLVPLDGSVPPAGLLAYADQDPEIAEAILKHEEMRARAAVRTFDDLIYDLAIEIQRNPTVREWLAGEFDEIIVDEYQDVDDAQQCVIFALAGEGKRSRIFAVGDEDQCIYGWRGSNLSYMVHKFEESLGRDNVARYELSRTFRYGHEIAMVANSLIRNNQERPQKLCVSNETTPRSSVHLRMASTKTGDRYWPQAVMDEIQEWAAKGRRNRDIAVLVRTYELAAPLEMHLIRTGTPYTLDGRGITSMPEVKAINAYAVMSDPDLYESCGPEGKAEILSAALSSPGLGVSRSVIQGLVSALADAPLSDVPKVLRSITPGGAMRPFQVTALHKRAAFIESLYSDGLSMADLGSRVWSTPGWPADVKRRIADPLKQSDRLNVVNLMCREIGRYESVEAMLDAFALRMEQQEQPEMMGDAIRIMSIHKSKGLEFPLVVIPGFTEGAFPHQMPDAPVDMEAERRLAFVAITRAIERVVLVAPNDLELANRWKIPVNPAASRSAEEADGITSRFLRELDPDGVRAARTWFYGEGDFPMVDGFGEYAAKAGKPLRGELAPAAQPEPADLEMSVAAPAYDFGF